MKRNTGLFVFVLALGTAFGAAQMQPGQTGPPMSQQPGMPQPPGTQPGMGQPGMGQPGIGQPGEDNTQTQTQGQVQQQPKVDDSTLQRQVHEQLASKGELANVQVSVSNGVVHLEGSVPNKADRKEAKKLAQSVPGVRGVKEKLEVNPNAGSSANTTTGAESTGQMNTGGTAGAASSGATTTPSSTTAAQNPASPVGSNPAQRGSQSPTGATLGESPCTCAPTSTSPTAAMPSPGAVSGSTAGTATMGTTQGRAATQGAETGVTAHGAMTGQSGTNPAEAGSANAQPSPAPGTQPNPAQPCSCPPSTSGSSTATPSAAPIGGTAGTAGAAAGATGSTGTQTPSAAGSVGAQTGAAAAQPGTMTESGQAGAANQPATSGMSTPPGPSVDIPGQIQTALQNDTTLSGSDIQVSAKGNDIVLNGTVPTGKEKETARRIAESFATDRKVVDHLKVTGKGNQQNTQPSQPNPY